MGKYRWLDDKGPSPGSLGFIKEMGGGEDFWEHRTREGEAEED